MLFSKKKKKTHDVSLFERQFINLKIRIRIFIKVAIILYQQDGKYTIF